jgi:hypothetical protein
MEQALVDAGYFDTEEMVVTVRDLFYSVRELYFTHPDFPEVKERLEAAWEKKGKTKKHGAASIDFEWFRKLLTAWQHEHRELDRLIWDVRGHLYEPHSETVTEIGTLSTSNYEFPEFVFDKLLYIEKEGEMGKVREAQLAEKYDMAILTGKGMPTEEIRKLLLRAEGEEFQVFCFHDADPDGYDIARVLGEETARMPGYSVEVIDLGLSYPDAERMGLRGEPFTRQKSLSQPMIERLEALEPLTWGRTLDLMTGTQIGPKSWEAWRYELNTIKPVATRMDYIEEKLREKGVRPKVVPPEEYLRDDIADRRDVDIRYEIGRAIDRIVRKDEIVRCLIDRFRDPYDERMDGAATWIRAAFEDDPTRSWSDVVEERIDEAGQEIREDLEAAVGEYIRENAGAEDDETDDE